MKHTLLCTILLCLLIGTVHAQNNSVTAWNNKQFTVGDTIVLGVKSMGYYYRSIKEITELNNRIKDVRDTIEYQKAIVKSVVGSDSRYDIEFGKRNDPEDFPIIIIESQNRLFLMNVNEAVYYDEVADYDIGREVAPVLAMTDKMLFVYNLKLYKKLITDDVVLEYMDHVDGTLKNNFTDNPFARNRYIDEYKGKLQAELDVADFSKLFRVRMTSDFAEYNIETKQFPVNNFSCPASDNFYFNAEKAVLFGRNRLIFDKMMKLKNVHWDIKKAEGFYNMLEKATDIYLRTTRRIQYNVYFKIDPKFRLDALNLNEFGSYDSYNTEALKSLSATTIYIEAFFVSATLPVNEHIRYNFMCGIVPEHFRDNINKKFKNKKPIIT